jgi:arabinose-5-phosphate isomerase
MKRRTAQQIVGKKTTHDVRRTTYDMISRGRQVVAIEAAAVRGLASRIDQRFVRAVRLLASCRGRVVVTGMGKAGIIAQKISATLSSTGTPSHWLHPAEALHGDMGRVTRQDVVVALSNSGETEEIVRLLPLIKRIGAPLVSIVGKARSTLAAASDVVLEASIKEEACPLGLAPSASTTAMLAMGDALALVLSDLRGFREQDFAFYHPGGLLGKRLLLTVGDLMRRGKAHAVVRSTRPVRDVLMAITQARAGSATIVDQRDRLVGIFTDGDLRRHLKIDAAFLRRPVAEVMTTRPTTIGPQRLAVEAMRILQERRVDELPVVDARGRPIGLLDVQDLLKAGLMVEPPAAGS